MTTRQRITAVCTAVLLGLGLAVAVAAPASADNPAYGPVRLTLGGQGGKCLDVTGVDTDNGALLQIYDCLPNQWNQQWYFYAKPGCFQCYQLVPRHSWKCADVVGVSLNNGAAVQQYDCLGFSQLNQIWQADFSIGGGWVTLVAMHSYKYLSRDGSYNGASIFQSTTSTSWYMSSTLS